MIYPAICVLCYLIVAFVKTKGINGQLLPLISFGLGIILASGILIFFPEAKGEIGNFETLLLGGLAGLAATGGDQAFRRALGLLEEKLNKNAKDVSDHT